MAIIDKIAHTLLPRRREEADAPPVGAEVMALRDNLDRWLERFFEEPWGLATADSEQWMPVADVRETDKELVITMEVPGLDRQDLDLSIMPDALAVRGEKREEAEDQQKGVRIVERRYGNFLRRVPLPPGLDLDHAEARVARGVLTVRFPKIAATAVAGRRIPVRTSV